MLKRKSIEYFVIKFLIFLVVAENDKWKQIDIKLDFSNFDEELKLHSSYLKYTIFPEVLKIIKNFVFVKEGGKIDSFFKTGCDDYLKVPETYLTPTNSDLIIFVKIVDTLEKFLAFSSPCAIQDSDNRPIIGLITINKNKIIFLQEYTDFLINSLVHEVFHILAFSPILFEKIPHAKKFIEKNVIGGKEIYKIKMPRVVYAAKIHFKCDAIDGIYLENEGGEKSTTSHFEKRLFGNEIMTSQMAGFPVISFFTLGFLEDTTWYKIDYTNSQELYWGKNKGCDFFFNKKCKIEYKEYCENENASQCSVDYLSKSKCEKNPFSDNCLLNDYENFKLCTKSAGFIKDFPFETPGTFSRCFLIRNNNNIKPACLESFCKNNNVFFKIENEEFLCEYNKSVIYKDQTIVCPDKSFCEFFNPDCTKDCNGRGYCSKNQKCICDSFFTGENCEIIKPCQIKDDFCKFFLLTEKNTKSIPQFFN